MDDGSSLVIVFYTHSVTASTLSYAPSVSLSLTKDGKHYQDNAGFKMSECSFAQNKCAVKIGKNSVEGDLQNYVLHYETDRVKAERQHTLLAT